MLFDRILIFLLMLAIIGTAWANGSLVGTMDTYARLQRQADWERVSLAKQLEVCRVRR